MNKFKAYLKIIFIPAFWMMNYKFSEEWDTIVNNLMDNFEPNNFKLTEYTATFYGTEIWIRNYPYAYGRTYKGTTVRPSRFTIIKLKNFIDTYNTNPQLLIPKKKINLIKIKK